MESEWEIIGDDRDELHAAFENVAEKAEKTLKEQGVAPDDVSRRRFNASINIETQPHNQWVKAYKVTLRPGG